MNRFFKFLSGLPVLFVLLFFLLGMLMKPGQVLVYGMVCASIGTMTCIMVWGIWGKEFAHNREPPRLPLINL